METRKGALEDLVNYVWNARREPNAYVFNKY